MSNLNADQAAWLEIHGVAGPFQRLAGGFRTDVLESRSGLIVRIGKSAADDNTFSTEKRVMNAVRSRVDIAIPRPTIVEDGSPEFPHGVMVYPKLNGVCPTLPFPALARSAASVLRKLHAIGSDLVLPQRIPGHDSVAALARLTSPCLTEAQGRTAERWQTDLVTFLAGEPPRGLIHGDFWHANWLATEDGQAVTGLLDFERAGLGLLHEDFAPLKYLGESFRADVLDAYCDGSAGDPALLLGETRMFDVLRELRGLGWALGNRDTDAVDDAIEKVGAALANYT